MFFHSSGYFLSFMRMALWVAWLRQEPWSTGRFRPAPWPAGPSWEEEAREAQQAMPKAA
jgi:hypothetical protein